MSQEAPSAAPTPVSGPGPAPTASPPPQQQQTQTPAPSTAGEPAVNFNDVFSLRKPKDAKAGLSSGLKSMAKGVVAGAAGLVAAPIVGAQREGWVGFGKGIAAGVVGAVVLPVTGVAVGTVQLVRGVVNTGEAISEAHKGKIWDEVRREWVDKPDGTIITADAAHASTRSLTKPATGVDYYEVLQVPRDAPPEAIKKAYYVLAKRWHPDKNPNDESAHQRFQLLGEAYQVLSNPDLRARYDRHGSAGLDSVNIMDGGEFFNMLFGSDLFEHLVGELTIAFAARSGMEGGSAAGSATMKAAQMARVERLATNLRALLARYVAGDVEGFKLSQREEARKLAAASFGETMLHAIGRVYEQQADIHLAGFFGALAARAKASTENMKSQVNAASAVIKVYQAQQKIEAWQREHDKKAAEEATQAQAAAQSQAEGGAVDGDAADGQAAKEKAGPSAAATKAATDSGLERDALEEAALPLMLEAMWAANVLDIQHTLRKVCRRVLNEEGVPQQDLRTRALGLKELGVIFQHAHANAPASADAQSGEAGAASRPGAPSSAAPPKKDAKRQMEEAMYKVLEKRNGGAPAE